MGTCSAAANSQSSLTDIYFHQAGGDRLALGEIQELDHDPHDVAVAVALERIVDLGPDFGAVLVKE